jgi:hypothetical protein
MPRDKSVKIWLDSLEVARLAVRAEEQRKSLSEYLGDLIALGAAQEDGQIPERTESVRPEPLQVDHGHLLAGEFLEMHFLSAILLRSVLVRLMGNAEADKLMARARVMAHDQAQAAVAELQPPKDQD